MNWLWASAIMMVLTALVHSWLGERRLIGPIIASDHGVMQRDLARKVLRFAWHFTSVLMLVNAAVVAWPGTPRGLIQITGIAWLGVGLFDAIYSRGQHVGWPALTLSGALALIGTLA